MQENFWESTQKEEDIIEVATLNILRFLRTKYTTDDFE